MNNVLLILLLPSIAFGSECTFSKCETNTSDTSFTNCDEDGFRTEELTRVMDPSSPIRVLTYENTSQCKDITHCSNDSPGTGHTLASGENGGPSVQKTISVERCYSYCLKFANPLVSAMCYCWYLNAYRFSNLSQKGTDFLCILRGIVPLSLCTG